MSKSVQTIVPTRPEQARALLDRLRVEPKGEIFGCQCYVGVFPSYEGSFGLVFPRFRVRRPRSSEVTEVAFVLRYVGIPIRELGLEEIKIAWSSLKWQTRRAINRVRWVVSASYVDPDPISLEGAWLLTMLEEMA